MPNPRPLAAGAGASSGIGHALAIAADRPAIFPAKTAFEALGADVRAVQTDLSTEEGVEKRLDPIGDTPVEAPAAYRNFHDNQDERTKVVLRPN